MVSKRSLTVVIGVLVLLTAITAATFMYIKPASTPQTKQGKVVIYAYNDRITGIDPSIEDDTGLVVLGTIYETLTYYDHETGEVKPRLAINWTSSEGGTEWTFHLRRMVSFHDGTPFNATAVKISVERARDIYRETGRGLGYIWDAVEEVEVVDEYTVKFRLRYPQRLDLLASAAYAAYIFSPSVLEKSGSTHYTDRKLEEWFNAGNAVGTGPYRLLYYDPVKEIRLEKFKDWWGWEELNNPDAPDIVVIKIVLEPASQYNGLLGGQIDIACSVPRENVKELEERGFGVIKLKAFHNFLLFFNTKRYPTNITEFRLAVAHALNLSRIINDVLLGYGQVASGVIPAGFPGSTEGFVYEYDLVKARDYLEKSGVKTPLSEPIELLYQVDYEETNKFAVIFKSVMSELGIEVKLNAQDWTRLKDIAKGVWEDPEKTPHIIMADWWPTVPSPYDYLYTMFHSDSREWNFAGYENEELNRLIDAAWELEGSNYEQALELYRQAHEIIFREAVAVGLWDEIRPFIYSKRIYVPQEALNPLYMYVIRFELVKVRS
ncbi:MAG: ABC transporter substrate-binding protein [Desulfurococcaceae archaeon]